MLTGREFFPALISAPFHHGLVVVFVAAASLATVAAFASLLRGGRPVPPDPRPRQAAEAPAEGTMVPAEGTKASSLSHRRQGPRPAGTPRKRPTRIPQERSDSDLCFGGGRERDRHGGNRG